MDEEVAGLPGEADGGRGEVRFERRQPVLTEGDGFAGSWEAMEHNLRRL
jgi:hypothetical protein